MCLKGENTNVFQMCFLRKKIKICFQCVLLCLIQMYSQSSVSPLSPTFRLAEQVPAVGQLFEQQPVLLLADGHLLLAVHQQQQKPILDVPGAIAGSVLKIVAISQRCHIEGGNSSICAYLSYGNFNYRS